MKKIIDLSNTEINGIKIIKFIGREKTHTYWECICHCGKIFITTTNNLRSGNTKSCGCSRGGVGISKNSKVNRWEFYEDMAIGFTNKNESFIVDLCDYDYVSKFCWRIDSGGYVVANSKDFKNKVIKLHKILTNSDANTIVDHVNQIKTDNRNCNLRIATKSQNNSNIKRKSNNSSGYTGVKFDKRSGKWKAQIGVNNKRIHLGTFKSKEEAILVRKEAEIKFHKEFNGEIVRKDFEGIVKNDSLEPDMEEAQEAQEV